MQVSDVASAAGARGGVIVVHGVMGVIALVSQCMPARCCHGCFSQHGFGINQAVVVVGVRQICQGFGVFFGEAFIEPL